MATRSSVFVRPPNTCECKDEYAVVIGCRYCYGMQVITKLHSILKPFLLRRVKSDVENSLPGKKELILYAKMTQQQRDFNEELRQNTLNVSAAICSCFMQTSASRRLWRLHV